MLTQLVSFYQRPNLCHEYILTVWIMVYGMTWPPMGFPEPRVNTSHGYHHGNWTGTIDNMSNTRLINLVGLLESIAGII